MSKEKLCSWESNFSLRKMENCCNLWSAVIIVGLVTMEIVSEVLDSNKIEFSTGTR